MSELLKGIIPIEKKFMQNNYLFALEFREGFVFGRTIRRRITQWKPWPLIDANGDDVDIPYATPHQAELRFRDPRNPSNAILYLSSTTNAGLPWFYHGAFGIKPQYINMYLRYPEGDIIPGKFPAVDPIRPSSGDDISPLRSQVSPYEVPTDYHECLIQPLQHIGAEYYNKDTARDHQPVLNILFCLYWTQLFKPETHPDLIANIASRRYPATFLTVGFGDHPQPIGDQTEAAWGATPLGLDEAMTLGGRY
ncbi:MAG: hypothetical protein ACETVR_03445 [Candidatus Bathyarchaeia archaeon]